MKFKKIGKKGGFVIPQEIRTELGLDGAMVKIVYTASGNIIISKADCVCNFCKAKVGTRFGKIDICEDCARLILDRCGGDKDEETL